MSEAVERFTRKGGNEMPLDGWILVSVLGACLAYAFGATPRETARVREFVRRHNHH